MAVGRRGDGGHFPDQTIGLQQARFRIHDVERIGIERRQRRHRADEDAHRVGVVTEAFDELLDVLMDHGVMGDVPGPALHLRGGGQFAIDDQIGGFQIVNLFGNLLDRISPVAQDPLVPVDVGDIALAGSGVLESGIIGHHPEIIILHLDLAQIHRIDGIVLDLHLVSFTGTVIGDG